MESSKVRIGLTVQYRLTSADVNMIESQRAFFQGQPDGHRYQGEPVREGDDVAGMVIGHVYPRGLVALRIFPNGHDDYRIEVSAQVIEDIRLSEDAVSMAQRSWPYLWPMVWSGIKSAITSRKIRVEDPIQVVATPPKPRLVIED
jgi:hypothetical protein